MSARSWWRRNRVALAFVVVFVPAVVFVVLGLPVIEVVESNPTPTVVAAGETVEAEGFVWSVDASGEFVGTGLRGDEFDEGDGAVGDGAVGDAAVGDGGGESPNGIPQGSAIAAAILRVTPVAPGGGADDLASSERAPICDVDLSDRSDERIGERSWNPIISPSEYGYGFADDTSTTCNLSEGEGFDFEAVYLTPAGVFETATLDVTLTTLGETTVLRFELGE